MRIRPLLLAPVAVLALAACGGGDGATDTAAGSSSTAPSASSEAPPAAGSSTPADADRPAPGSCVDLPEAPDGRYTVADAGTVTVDRDGDRLVLAAANPAEGWTADEVDRDDDEVEVEFRGDGVELDFEAEIDDGRLDVEVCSDDD